MWAISLACSSRSKLVSSSISLSSWLKVIFRWLFTSFSTGIIASNPYTVKNWVSPVLLRVVVRYAHNIICSSSTQAPFLASRFVFKICLIILLTASTYPLAWGWSTAVKLFWISSDSQNWMNCSLVNWVPLSVIIYRETPNLQIILSHVKFCTFALEICASSLASAQLVK